MSKGTDLPVVFLFGTRPAVGSAPPGGGVEIQHRQDYTVAGRRRGDDGVIDCCYDLLFHPHVVNAAGTDCGPQYGVR
jgi:hypothetical protein